MSTRVLQRGGCRLAHEVAGQGPPVLFIQGVGVHGGGWRAQARRFRRSSAASPS